MRTKEAKKYCVHISIYDHELRTSKRKYLGYFGNKVEASNVYKKARKIEAQKWRDVMKTKHNWYQDLLEKIK